MKNKIFLLITTLIVIRVFVFAQVADGDGPNLGHARILDVKKVEEISFKQYYYYKPGKIGVVSPDVKKIKVRYYRHHKVTTVTFAKGVLESSTKTTIMVVQMFNLNSLARVHEIASDLRLSYASDSLSSALRNFIFVNYDQMQRFTLPDGLVIMRHLIADSIERNSSYDIIMMHPFYMDDVPSDLLPDLKDFVVKTEDSLIYSHYPTNCDFVPSWYYHLGFVFLKRKQSKRGVEKN